MNYKKKYAISITLILLILILGILFLNINLTKHKSNSNIKSINEEKSSKNKILKTSYYSSLRLNVKQYGAIGDGHHDDWKAIQLALNRVKSNGGGTVYIPNGKYIVTHALRIYSNTYLKLAKDAIIVRKDDGTVVINGEVNGQYTGYNGQGNILIEGGIFLMNDSSNPKPGTAFGIARANGLVIRNVKVLNIVNSHGIDLNSSKNVVIENCKFMGFKDTTNNKSRGYAEAVQIANHTKIGFSILGVYDGTPCENVKVSHCIFGNNSKDGFGSWGVGIGDHSLGVIGKYNRHIQITKNTFLDCSFSGIHINSYKDTEITGNRFEECEHSIFVFTPSETYTSKGIINDKMQVGEDIYINKNQFINTQKENILISGNIIKNNEKRYSKIKINNNNFISTNRKIKNNIPNIKLELCQGLLIRDNYFKGTTYNIQLLNSDESRVLNNKLLSS
ncbi:hypothetical protein G4D61_05305 [Bacillus ginsengihumi]|uniref:Rhamnogalacturonase A/B/Epimerase-like pectate lyase domain-containing protein n=1 Tax=Heyndrickxia ginsengihumi TaxID=363870 RepID=A0A6M0P534_9BACI|nr:right-handed parallel beta-helix repeat-containing protein [Heyndrickxia ginsengihumi]NEY19385.1 hypothetical protein [Heyndrickxia ginsengihumi]